MHFSIESRRVEPTYVHPSPGQEWLAELAAGGATVVSHRVEHFGDPAGELRAARDTAIVCDLSHLGTIAATGADVGAFLQGQLSSDLRELKPDRAQFSSYNTPKGRMLASFLVYQTRGSVALQLPHELVDPLRKRLSMFVLRSKVQLADTTDAFVRIGVAGAGAAALVASTLGKAPQCALAVEHSDTEHVIRLPGDRFEIVAELDRARGLWKLLTLQTRPVGTPVWNWLEIRAGIPVITRATQDQFVPQMVNLEVIGGVSFQKGCYPGQEIVARTQYLGKLKRRMYLAHVGGDLAPAPGNELYSRDLEGQSSGTVVNAVPAPDGGFDLLAVIQTSSVGSEPVHLGSLEGPVLEIQPLPYAVP